jgi:hypothetical protein
MDDDASELAEKQLAKINKHATNAPILAGGAPTLAAISEAPTSLPPM